MNFPEGFPGDSDCKESACNAGGLDLIPGLERSPGEGNSYPLQYPGLYREFHGLYSPGGHNESDTTELSRRKYSLEQRAKLFLFGSSNT